MEFCLTKVRSPNYLLQLSNELAQRGEYELLLKMAAQCQLRIKEIMEMLAALYSVGAYPGGTPHEEKPPEIDEKEPFRVLITTILSQRTRDENTRAAAANLFAKYRTPKELANAKPRDIEPLIKKAGFPQQKSKKIIETAKCYVPVFDNLRGVFVIRYYNRRRIFFIIHLIFYILGKFLRLWFCKEKFIRIYYLWICPYIF